MRMRKKKYLEERLAAVSDYLFIINTEDRNFNTAVLEKEYISLVECYGQELTTQLITYLDEYIEMKGYKAKSHFLCMKRWVIDAVKNNRYKNTRQPIRKELEPEWLNKDIKSEMATPEEIAEIKEMLKGYK